MTVHTLCICHLTYLQVLHHLSCLAGRLVSLLFWLEQSCSLWPFWSPPSPAASCGSQRKSIVYVKEVQLVWEHYIIDAFVWHTHTWSVLIHSVGQLDIADRNNASQQSAAATRPPTRQTTNPLTQSVRTVKCVNHDQHIDHYVISNSFRRNQTMLIQLLMSTLKDSTILTLQV